MNLVPLLVSPALILLFSLSLKLSVSVYKCKEDKKKSVS